MDSQTDSWKTDTNTGQRDKESETERKGVRERDGLRSNPYTIALAKERWP